MSTLTKVLIILLTISSIFLCGLVATYVSSAENFRDKYNATSQAAQAAQRSEENTKRQYDAKVQETDQLKAKLGVQITDLEQQLTALQGKLDQSEREKSALQQRVDGWVGVTQNFSTSTQSLQQLLKNAMDELVRTRADQTKLGKELDETSTTLVEKLAVIALLEQKNKRLVEEKAELNDKLNTLLQQFGKAVIEPEPVSAKRTEAAVVAPLAKDIALKGLIEAVDIKNSMAQLSIGSADGVKEGMKFHVTRGSEYICDVLILDVDTDKSLGTLELTDVTSQQPKVGDNVSTNL